MLVYATATDLAALPWSITPAPGGVDRLLWSASALVTTATRSAVYAVDEEGMPTDPAILAAFRDATCAQVSTWVALGIDPAAGGADAATATGRIVTSKSLGPASFAYAGVDAAVARRAAAATRPVDDARAILDQAGLLTSSPRVRG